MRTAPEDAGGGPTDIEEGMLEALYDPAKECDPTESPNTNLETIPESATISYRSGRTRDSALSFIVKRAMLDPHAEVIPYEQ